MKLFFFAYAALTYGLLELQEIEAGNPPPMPPIPTLVSFKISGYSTRSNIPDMKVTFENGITDSMVLEPYAESSCNFIGQLASYPSTVAVTGCLKQPGDKMSITLLSDFNAKSHMYEMDYDGNVELLENPFKYQEGPSGIIPLNRDGDFEQHDDKMGDEEKNKLDEELAGALASAAVTWPPKLYAYVKFGYERTMKAQLGSQGISFGTWIDSVMTHVQTYYKHPTLPTKIMFKYDKGASIYKDVSWPSTDYLKQAAAAGVADGDDKIDLYAWFGKDSEYYGTVGLAYVGGACTDRIKTSFNEWRRTAAQTAMVLAHEMGHNFGMSHDFDAKHGGKSGACNGQGIMSYGNAPSKWSSCSVSDFTGYYNEKSWGTTCLKDWSAHCGDACPGGSCSISDPNFCSNAARYGGCKGKYKNYFDSYCKKTCGICGGSSSGGSTNPNPAPSCNNVCPGSSCPLMPRDQGFCTDSRYGGCNGKYKSYYNRLCKKTCNKC